MIKYIKTLVGGQSSGPNGVVLFSKSLELGLSFRVPVWRPGMRPRDLWAWLHFLVLRAPVPLPEDSGTSASKTMSILDFGTYSSSILRYVDKFGTLPAIQDKMYLSCNVSCQHVYSNR